MALHSSYHRHPLALIPYTDSSNVSQVLIFNLISTVPSLLQNIILGYRADSAPSSPRANRVVSGGFAAQMPLLE